MNTHQTVRVTLKDAPTFIAELVRQGVTFKAYQDGFSGSDITIEFLGGY